MGMKLAMSKQNGSADYFDFVQFCLRLTEIKAGDVVTG